MFFTFYYQDIAIVVEKRPLRCSVYIVTKRPLESSNEVQQLHVFELLTERHRGGLKTKKDEKPLKAFETTISSPKTFKQIRSF